MKIDVCFTPAELASTGAGGAAVVVIDALRATSSIVEALANGARAVLPVATPEEATALVQRLGKDDVLRCGERRGSRIEGFELGNSPGEFSADVVANKLLAMTTTNGTPALLAAANAKRVVVASFLNLSAVAESLQDEDRVVVSCAGREGAFALEDAMCAGALTHALRDRVERSKLNDAAVAASALSRPAEKERIAALKASAAGRSLTALGLAADIVFCAAIDRHTVVPEFRERRVTVAKS